MRKLRIILEMIKFEHTLFALPFAYMGLILGNFYVEGTWPSFHEFIWTTVAMVGARSAAMSLNRVIDRVIDGKNPRTAKRAIPAGLISVAEVWLFIIVSFLLLFIAAFQLNLLAVKLLPLAVFVLVFYSYTKRFTWLSHLVLGVALGFAPWAGGSPQPGERMGWRFSSLPRSPFGRPVSTSFMRRKTLILTGRRGFIPFPPDSVSFLPSGFPAFFISYPR
ncbi:membrane hypothetical protein [[Clostridium] ultunense Esp]|nr:membrane hypothetical protein [[Clostridium] ultunense Esp]